MFFKNGLFLFLSVLVLVILSAQVRRFSVSCMPDFDIGAPISVSHMQDLFWGITINHMLENWKIFPRLDQTCLNPPSLRRQVVVHSSLIGPDCPGLT